jgi:CheY-like chemotaxis protein
MSGNKPSLRFLVVEDEALVSMLIEDMLTDFGHEVVAVASRIQDACDVARVGNFDIAILDVNLNGQPSFPVAKVLRDRDIPFAFATGYGAKGLDGNFAAVPTIAKPFVAADLEKLIVHLTT